MSQSKPNDNPPKDESSEKDTTAFRGPTVVDQRSGIDRRDVAPQAPSGFERRRGPGRRRTDFMKAAEEGEMSREQFQFLLAIDTFKKNNNKTFPTWTDVLEIARLLGYRKTAEMEVNLPHAEDWKEKPDAPSNVRTISYDFTESE